ncbi:cytochrome c assembly protein [Cellulomonas flavigena DSM 20109]|uniref:Cytochrome c assembly protein n=1 Tax=Cellulomonas flavigena (strain ATCC 482 / DSM 20109 / BCRC 11376 / JCM 18109 / NBRC 3775 / NCIMB 8073 / NRS 134) TaxID=446466 RepID=D5UJH9_CELFN|nr:c-type cytochrome biogenesis protein CcsB [Cellulomonas flavigena]ADG75617.1 cytochrome c assembly protein [Cellulomonas flavigena DSM 20109]
MTVAELSDLFVWSAATALTITLIAWSVELARITEAAQAARAARSAREPVAVGAGASPAPSPTQDAPVVPVGGKAAGIARSTLVLGTVLLLVAIVLRGVAAGRWPTANMYEFTIVGVLVALVALFVQQRRRPIAFVGVLVTGMSLLALVLALNTLHVQADAVQPALQHYWLVLHVGVAIIATGISTVAFATTVLQVLRDARSEGRSRLEQPWTRADGVRQALHGARVTGPAFAWLDQVPDARRLEASSFRQHAVAFVLWSLTLIGGSIWAEEAWGRYWGWDPKEVGTFVAWVVYAAYLHARTTRGWAGRRAAYLVFVAYSVVLVNFTVVNLFVDGKHSYSGL